MVWLEPRPSYVLPDFGVRCSIPAYLCPMFASKADRQTVVVVRNLRCECKSTLADVPSGAYNHARQTQNEVTSNLINGNVRPLDPPDIYSKFGTEFRVSASKQRKCVRERERESAVQSHEGGPEPRCSSIHTDQVLTQRTGTFEIGTLHRQSTAISPASPAH